MSGVALLRHRLDARWPGPTWGPALLVLAAGAIALAVLFRTEASAAVRVWRQSTAFGHCFLVGPIAAWLAWERRGALAGEVPRPRPVLAFLALPLAVAWFVAERLSLMEGRQLSALFLAWLLVPAVLGPRIARTMAVPLLYSIFLVPFGAFLVPPLQTFTAWFVDAGLDVLGVPHLVTATLIEIPEGRFAVVEACAGLRFLIAAIAFGVLYACVIYRRGWRRAGFIAVCVAVPVLANGLRVLGIVILGRLRGSAEAGAVDHVLYGWIFFSLVIALLVLLGLPFREDRAAFGRRGTASAAAAARQDVGLAGVGLAGVVAVGLAAAGPAVTGWLAWRARNDEAALSGMADRLAASLAIPADCTAAPPQAGRRRLTCRGIALEAAVQLFGLRHGAAAVRAWHDATDPGEAEEAHGDGLETPDAHWRVVTSSAPDRVLAAALWLDGQPVSDGLPLRLRLARAGFGPPRGTFLLVSLRAPAATAGAAAALAELAAAQHGVSLSRQAPRGGG